MEWEPAPVIVEQGRRVWETYDQARERLIADHKQQREVLYGKEGELQRAAALKQRLAAGHELYIAAEASKEAEAQKAAQVTSEEKLKVEARSAYMVSPAATEKDFERAWPAMREHLLQQRAIEALTQSNAIEGVSVTQQYLNRKYTSADKQKG